MCMYVAIRHCIEADWLNDRDQFLYPNDGWKTDTEFQNDCLAFTLFHGQNRISSTNGVNHWIPFTENEVDAQDKFNNRFMTDFINGKSKIEKTDNDLFSATEKGTHASTPLGRRFLPDAQNVFNAGRELWRYFHAQTNVNVNASLYDIREHFQGRNDKQGKRILNNILTHFKY
ncbi:hypothetical protein EZS27_020216 [termite gut metagenome]|uniref:Uncharacterized protein n=1 Tax=termite gut metagenome TaxID=433724 RepID=A0A5J4RB24_9ZZZZ